MNETFVLEIDSRTRHAFLRNSDGEIKEVEYNNDHFLSKLPGWRSAPNVAYSSLDPEMCKAIQYAASLGAKPQVLEHVYDAKAPYGLWAKYALNNIKIEIHKQCWWRNTLDIRDKLYVNVERFLYDTCKGKPTKLRMYGLEPLVIGRIFVEMSYFIGNDSAESVQLAQIVEYL